MKKLLYTLLALLLIAGVAVISCPNKDDHSQALKELVNSALKESVKNANEEDAGMAMFGSMIGSSIAGLFLDTNLEVDNYFVCSVGTITYNGKPETVSVGVFNHIFTISKEDFMDNLYNMR